MAFKTSAISRHNTRYDNAIKAKDDDGGFLWRCWRAERIWRYRVIHHEREEELTKR